MSSIINFYEHLPKNLKKKPKFDKSTNMSLPYRLILCGASGSGKTNVLLNLIKLQSQNFQRIVICTRNANEPLYNFLRMKIPEDQLEIHEGIEAIPEPEFYADSTESILMVFDDLMLEKNQDEKISPFFIRGRKLAGGISCAYLSQNYTKIPLNVRRNCNYVILKKISSNKEITAILKNYSLECSKEALITMYNNCTKNLTDFLMIDLDAPDHQRFRHNFKQMINLC